MSQIQAIIGCAVHLHDFANIELFVQGHYQIRVYFSTCLYPLIRAKLTVKSTVEHSRDDDGAVSFAGCVHPNDETVACSAMMRILYKLEEVRLNDTFLFELTTAVSPEKILQDFENLGLSMFAELWFAEKSADPLSINSMHLLCTRRYSIVFDPRVGIDTSLPVMFDCFHLCLVRLTLHCSLLAVVPLPAPTNSLAVRRGTGNVSALFGWEISELGAEDLTAERRERAFSIYRTICELLLISRESLLKKSEAMSKLASGKQNGAYTLDTRSAPTKLIDEQTEGTSWKNNFHGLVALFEGCENMELIEGIVHQQLTKCSAENILIWNCFLEEVAFKKQVITELARHQMYMRLLRFSECFFYKECDRDKALNVTLDAHNGLFDAVQKSSYSSHPFPLVVECPELDGTSASLPVIIEERYCSDATDTVKRARKQRLSVDIEDHTPGLPGRGAKLAHRHSHCRSALWPVKNSCLRPLPSTDDWDESGVMLVSFRKIHTDADDSTAMSDDVHPKRAGPRMAAATSSTTCLPIAMSRWPLRKRRAKARRHDVYEPASTTVASGSLQNPLNTPNSSSGEMHPGPDAVERLGKMERKSKSFTEELTREGLLTSLQIRRPASSPALSCRNKKHCWSDDEESDRNDSATANVNGGTEKHRSAMASARSLPNLPLRVQNGQTATECLPDSAHQVRPFDDSFQFNSLPADRRQAALLARLDVGRRSSTGDQKAVDSLLETCCFYTRNVKRFYMCKSTFLREQFQQAPLVFGQYRLYGSNLSLTGEDCGVAAHLSHIPILSPTDFSEKAYSTESDSLASCSAHSWISSDGKWAKSSSIAGNLAEAYAGISDAAYDCIDGQCYSLNTSGNVIDASLPVHLIVCVHGLDGDCNDLRLFRTFLYLCQPKNVRVEFLMSSWNHNSTFGDFDAMVNNLFGEIVHFIEKKKLKTSKMSFIGHSMGNVIIRALVGSDRFAPFVPLLHTFLSLGGPHLGLLFGTHGIINIGLWIMQKWKKSMSLLQLAFKDKADIKQTFMYKLSKKPCFQYFKNVLLVASPQDHYAPFHSARIEPCKSALKDSIFGSVYVEMVSNLLAPILKNSSTNFIRYTTYHPSSSATNELMGGRSAHIAALDSEIFVEKLIRVSVAKYFF